MQDRYEVDPEAREAVIRWEDPRASAGQVPGLSGLEFLQKISTGQIPGAPIGSHVNMALVSVEKGQMVFHARPDEFHYNLIGTVHGGYLCTLLDSALGCAAHTLLPAGTGYTSIDIAVNFLRPVTAQSGTLVCTGRVVKPGRRVSFAEVDVVDGNKAVVATATSSLLIFPLPTASQ